MTASRRLMGVGVVGGLVVLTAAVALNPGSGGGAPVAAPPGPKAQPARAELSLPPARAAVREAAPDAGRRLTPALAERCLEVARDVDPQYASRLEGLRQARPEAFERSIRQARHLRGLVRLKERDPKLYSVKVEELQVDARVNRVLEELADVRRSGGESAGLEAELHELVRTQVSLSIAARGMYLRTLEDHVRILRDRLDQDGKNFDRTVEERYRRLLERLEQGLPPESRAADEG